MNKLAAVAGAILLAAMACAEEPKPEETAPEAPKSGPKLETVMDKASYTIGMNIGSQFKQDGLTPNVEALAQGIKDAIAGAESRLSEAEMAKVMQDLQQELNAKREEETKNMAANNKKEGEDFLAQNGKKEGVVTTNSGLQYTVLKEGEGTNPAATDRVTVHYEGRLINGTVFDSSVKRGQPATFPLDGVIKGWTEGVQLMKPGSKYRFFIPSELAYGASGPPGSPIGPNSTLIFDVELLSIGHGK